MEKSFLILIDYRLDVQKDFEIYVKSLLKEYDDVLGYVNSDITYNEEDETAISHKNE